ncbi:MAG: lipoyl(octanoyl) transferase LipB, partial [Gammaproteobacteria bacterium]
LNTKQLVAGLENGILAYLEQLGIVGHKICDKPGVYVGPEAKPKKIASIGLRIKKGCSYHGLSFNWNLDLKPFSFINPCGYENLEVARLIDLSIGFSSQFRNQIISDIIKHMLNIFNFNIISWEQGASLK